MSDSIFTKIIKGEITCHKVYEDEKTLAFMDIHPVQKGMVLVISKTPYETFLDMPNADYQDLMATVQKVGQRLKDLFPERKRISVQIEGLDVPHVHVKLFPIDTGDDFRAKPDFDNPPSDEELSELANKLAF